MVNVSREINKATYKIFLYLVKILPFVISCFYFIYNLLACFDVEIIFISMFSGTSILTILMFYMISYIFRFCIYHKIFIHFILLNNVLNVIDYYCKYNIVNVSTIILFIICCITALILKKNEKCYQVCDRFYEEYSE